jgi:TonB family protein
MNEAKKIARQVKGLPESSGSFLILLLFAIGIHLALLTLLPNEILGDASSLNKQKQSIRLKINDSKTNPNQLLFTKQTQNTPPKEAKFYSFEDHSTKNNVHQSALKNDAVDTKGGNAKSTPLTEPLAEPKTLSQDEGYKKFLPSRQALGSETEAGLKEFIDQEMTLGVSSDANALKHPLMGFFAQIRKNVELAFYDPSEVEIARYMNINGYSGIRGAAVALIEIDQSGKISQLKIVQPSGHSILDEHWLKILRASSPFQPIPKSWPNDHLRFTYTLNYRYGSG